jgi:fructose transport system ATP-binding protein
VEENYILEARNITKHFGGVAALNNVTLQLRRGELLGLVGDNGAGKSTLVKIISGALSKDSGEIYLEGKKVEINTPSDALALGIQTVYQDLGLVDSLDLPSNIFLGREVVSGGIVLNKGKMYRESANLMEELKISIGNLKRIMSEYSGGQRQVVSLTKIFYWGKKIVILDEPTAALGQQESKTVLHFIRTLRDHGLSMIIISHNLQHVFSLVDRIMILRRGDFIDVKDVHETTAEEIVSQITGAGEYYERV